MYYFVHGVVILVQGKSLYCLMQLEPNARGNARWGWLHPESRRPPPRKRKRSKVFTAVDNTPI